MFYYVEGNITHTAPSLAVVDCGGVGYAVHTTMNTLRELTVGKSTRLYTHLIVREDAMELYGFADMEELNCFRMLIAISGVGPKAAISILSGATPARLALGILSGDEKTLTSAPGIGKKIAQRIILELKDKMAKSQLGSAANLPSAAILSSPSGKTGEAVQALLVLGYSSIEAAEALSGADIDAMSTEDMIKYALKKLAKA